MIKEKSQQKYSIFINLLPFSILKSIIKNDIVIIVRCS
jgi:hypothetical protein